MKLSMVFLALFSIFTLVVIPLPSSVTTVLAFLVLTPFEPAVQRHVANKPSILRRLRQRKYLCGIVGVLLERLFISVFTSTVMIWFYIFKFGGKISRDISLSEYEKHGESSTLEFLKSHPICEWGWGTLFLILLFLPQLASDLLTPWILTLDYSFITSMHRYIDDVPGDVIVKDIVAFGAAGAIGMRITDVVLSWAFDLFSVINGGGNQSQLLVATLKETALNVMQMLRVTAGIIICQLTFCMAAAERDVLGKKWRFGNSIAIGYCALFYIPFHYDLILETKLPFLTRLPILLRKVAETAFSLAFVEHCRRRYLRLLSAVRQRERRMMLAAAPTE